MTSILQSGLMPLADDSSELMEHVLPHELMRWAR